MKDRRLTVVFALLLTAGCVGEPPAEKLDLGTPIESSGVAHTERLSDARRAIEGAAWNSSSAALFRGNGAYVVFDLGASTPVEAVYVQGDNNDRFRIEVSDDGKLFSDLWVAPTRSGAGLRTRSATQLGGSGRFVRISGIGGDRWISISEIQLFSSIPETWPPRVAIDIEMTPPLWTRFGLIAFALLAVAAAVFHRRGSRRSKAIWVLTLLAAAAAVYAVVTDWPIETGNINLSRAVAAAVACAAVARLGLRPDGANRPLLTALLAAMALLSVLTFYNFGYPQFHDVKRGQPTYVHTWDMRVYFPAVKYFDELGYDGVYLASVKAFADARLGGSLDTISDVRLRDLRDYEMRSVAELSEEIQGIESRFSPERWRELEQDMAYFWQTMGRQAYFDSLRDHGGNATPAWLLVASLIYDSADATESTFLWAALLDPLLLLIFFAAAWRTFGLRVALVCMVAFGAATVYQFGSNWGGSTLRNDWMVLIGLGVCALKSKRFTLAGVLLGWAAMIRAFPLLALLFLAAPVGWRIFEAWQQRRAGAPEQRVVREAMPLFKVAAGVVVVVIALGAATTAKFGWDESWGAWSHKISMHANRPNVNHLGLTALVSFDPDNLWHNLRARGVDPELWGPLTAQTMNDRRFIILAGMIAYTVLALLACRRLRLADAAVIGTMMIPIYFYPSNYYLHILFIWPLMLASWDDGSRDRQWSLAAATVLAACAVMWFAWLIPGNYGQFLFWSGVLLAAILVLLLIPILSDRSADALARPSED
jgi:hypothetical protein